MIRNTLLLLFAALLAASSVLGADFPFAARVDVLQSIVIVEARLTNSTNGSTALSMLGTQDQCLDLQWLGETRTVPSEGATPPDRTRPGLYRLDQDGRGLVAPAAEAAPQGSTLQVNLN